MSPPPGSTESHVNTTRRSVQNETRWNPRLLVDPGAGARIAAGLTARPNAISPGSALALGTQTACEGLDSPSQRPSQTPSGRTPESRGRSGFSFCRYARPCRRPPPREIVLSLRVSFSQPRPLSHQVGTGTVLVTADLILCFLRRA
uniref:Uncharacterized protein n=1 Tax=Rousettus aegyptiacus TaxID=9407 RepID=A0A7J8BFN2_ROUAE|nr:hypothetical protein HJG63_009757 [Rousettus aegyptiacus]